NAGIADAFEKENLKIFAPRKNAAILEGSKDFAKQFMDRHEIPTAKYQTFTDAEQEKAYIEYEGATIVIKADRLDEGKGITVDLTVADTSEAIKQMIVKKSIQEAVKTIVIEDL